MSVFEKGKRDELGIRLISLTSIPCKSLKKNIKHLICKYLAEEGMIPKNEHGA